MEERIHINVAPIAVWDFRMFIFVAVKKPFFFDETDKISSNPLCLLFIYTNVEQSLVDIFVEFSSRVFKSFPVN